jgi:hypothetical protein
MHVTYGRERSKTARRATADIVSNSAQRGLDEGRNEPLTAYIITADGKELYAIVLTKSAGVHRCFYFQSASSARPDSNHSQTTSPIQHHISRNSTCRPRQWAVYAAGMEFCVYLTIIAWIECTRCAKRLGLLVQIQQGMYTEVNYRIRQQKLPCSSLAQISGGILWSRTDRFWPTPDIACPIKSEPLQMRRCTVELPRTTARILRSRALQIA